MTTLTDYKTVQQAYKAIANNDDLNKSKQYFSSIDTDTGNYKDGSALAGRVINALDLLDQSGTLCGSFQVTLKHNDHDLGGYYSVEIYMVEVTCDDDSDIYDTVENYMSAGREQVENIISKYEV